MLKSLTNLKAFAISMQNYAICKERSQQLKTPTRGTQYSLSKSISARRNHAHPTSSYYCRAKTMLGSKEAMKFAFKVTADTPVSELIGQCAVLMRKPFEYLTVADIFLLGFLSHTDVLLVMNAAPFQMTSADEMMSNILSDDALAMWLCRRKNAVWNLLYTSADYMPFPSHETMNHFVSLWPNV